MILGIGEGENFLASDVPAILQYTRKVIYMDNYEMVRLTPDAVEVYDLNGDVNEKPVTEITWDAEAAEKGGYEHFMMKEIHEQPKVIRDTISSVVKGEPGSYTLDLSGCGLSQEELKKVSRIWYVACGSAYHAGLCAQYVMEDLAEIPVRTELASEFRYRKMGLASDDLVVVISQSGETLDSMAALRKARDLGARILSIVNVVGSSIARESDHVLYTWAGPEIAVATTKAYSTQLVLLDMLGIWFADICGRISSEEYSALLEELRKLPEKMEMILKNTEDIKYFASRYFNHDSVFYIGRNLDYALGLESSLKLKEISYVHSEAYASGELKHGTISLIENGTLVIALSTFLPLFDKELSNIIEVKSRGADVIALTTCDMAEELKKTVQNVLCIPRTSLIFQPSLGIIPMQLFAYYVALQRGCDIDKPRNLAKSVTVE